MPAFIFSFIFGAFNDMLIYLWSHLFIYLFFNGQFQSSIQIYTGYNYSNFNYDKLVKTYIK